MATFGSPSQESVFVRACFHPLWSRWRRCRWRRAWFAIPTVLRNAGAIAQSLDHKLLRLRARGLASAKVKRKRCK